MKRALWVFLALFVLALLSISCYGMGSDLIPLIPSWLVAFIIGAVAMTIGTILAIIFALGIVKIRDIFKEE